jgi:LysR family transcriptional regulator, glycine cleavage system transcriptional activator
VALTADGFALLQAVEPSLARIDATVRQIRQAHGRRSVGLTTFASFASLWLIPRLQSFQADHPDIDIRISAGDVLVDLAEADVDLALRYCRAEQAGPGAQRLFGEVVTPVVGSAYARQAAAGSVPPLRSAADLAHHTLLEEDDQRPSSQYLSWRYWLAAHGQQALQPQRWLYLNYTYQQIQGAMAGQGVALARLPLISDAIERGELVEPFGPAGRLASPLAYWLMRAPHVRDSSDLRAFCAWVDREAAQTRTAIGEAA